MSVAALAGLLGFAAQAAAQIPGMPLFTNPRFATGLRVHADVGQPTAAGTGRTGETVAQVGASVVLGPIAVAANVGTNLNRALDVANGASYSMSDNATGSALAQLHLYGGGRNNMSLSVFGGASADVTGTEIAAGTMNIQYPKFANFPVGAALGLRIPLGLASLNVWGAGRYVFSKYVNCPASDPIVSGVNIYPGLSQMCDETEKNFRWAVGADLPILRILSVRAAYDSGKIGGEKVDYWGIGASIGIGGMR